MKTENKLDKHFQKIEERLNNATDGLDEALQEYDKLLVPQNNPVEMLRRRDKFLWEKAKNSSRTDIEVLLKMVKLLKRQRDAAQSKMDVRGSEYTEIVYDCAKMVNSLIPESEGD